MHKTELHCRENMSEEHRLKILILSKLVSLLLTSSFVEYLDNKYISIDEEHCDFRQFITSKKIKSFNWIVTRGDDLGSISMTPMPKSFFEKHLSKAQKRQYDVLQDKLEKSSLNESGFKIPVILYACFKTNHSYSFQPIFTTLTLEQSAKMVVNELAYRNDPIYIENNRSFLSLDAADSDTVDCLQECAKFFTNLRATESEIKSSA